MVHELRLVINLQFLGENFDLRETNENLADQIKRLKNQLKMYMRKVQENGGKQNQAPISY